MIFALDVRQSHAEQVLDAICQDFGPRAQLDNVRNAAIAVLPPADDDLLGDAQDAMALLKRIAQYKALCMSVFRKTVGAQRSATAAWNRGASRNDDAKGGAKGASSKIGAKGNKSSAGGANNNYVILASRVCGCSCSTSPRERLILAPRGCGST